VPGAAPEASFSAAPNPTHGLLQVQGVTDAHAGFELMAADGRQVNIRPVRNGTTVTFDLGSCPPGLYLLRRWSDTGSTVERIVRE
ncbi:MAG TPA: T9SS type A sorting domain-containing protein, partial [Flavobacteriales bacterium]|nr:T9SS type A sorting domain-containing protein [Flavobacteriales bacterium]